MNKNFYCIGQSFRKNAVEILTNVEYPSSTHIPVDSELITSNNFEIAVGDKFFDIVPFAESAVHFAISERLKKILETNNITGWTCFPITIDQTEMEYFVFRPTSLAGPILNLEKVNNYEEHIKFDLNTWDGSGIFTLKNTILVVCTEDVKIILENAKITNIRFRPM